MEYILTNSKELQEIIQRTVGDQMKTISPVQTQRAKTETLLTRKETAELLKVTPVTLWQWDRTGKLKALRLNSRVRYRMKDVETFINETV